VIPYEPFVELAERLVGLVGGDRKAAFFNSGAEAVENAVKFAKATTGRPAIVAFEGGFHGVFGDGAVPTSFFIEVHAESASRRIKNFNSFPVSTRAGTDPK
jgi:4-aminobutyrate aminotransferase-like enzyme